MQFLPNPLPYENSPFLLNPVPYLEDLYWSISTCLVKLTVPKKQFSNVGLLLIL